MSNKRVLIITYYWPPSGGVGVQRWLHFARNMKKSGWEPIIYTPSNPQFEIQDEHLIQMTEGLKVVRKEIWEPFSLFHKLTGNKEKQNIKQGTTLEKSDKSFKDNLFVWIRGNLLVPDSRVFWVKPSISFLKNYLVENEIGTIITTGPPHSMHMIGSGLKKAIPGLNWVADFRDPWSDWDILDKLKTGLIAMSRHKRLERSVLKNADRVLTVSPRLAQSLSDKIKGGKKVDVVMNGVSLDRMPSEDKIESQEKFVIGYFGMLNELRNPQVLWEALDEMCGGDKHFNRQFELRLGGIVSDSILAEINNKPNLNGKVNYLGYLSHDEIFAEYKQCDLLLLLLNKSDNAKWILPVKFFEYLSANRPILTFGPADSDLGDIINQNTIGEIMGGEDKSEISKFILSIFASGYPMDMEKSRALLQQYSREGQSEELLQLLDQL